MSGQVENPFSGFGEADRQVLEKARMILQTHWQRETFPVFENPAATRLYLESGVSALEFEVFGCLWLDTRHRLIADERLFRGTVDGTAVYPREVVKSALGHNASAVVFYHNHPSGIPEPSRADETITRRLIEALRILDVRVLDHIVVGKGVSVSMAERGLV